jgi:hypothetical protein
MFSPKHLTKDQSEVHTNEEVTTRKLHNGSPLSPKTHELKTKYEAAHTVQSFLKNVEPLESVWWQETSAYPRSRY